MPEVVSEQVSPLYGVPVEELSRRRLCPFDKIRYRHGDLGFPNQIP